jgi:hypothetical protein
MYTLSYFNRKGDRHSIEIAKGDLLPVLLWELRLLLPCPQDFLIFFLTSVWESTTLEIRGN